MAKQADIIIIGGGIFGAALLFYLTRQADKRIMLFEKQRFTSGATGCSGGFIRVLHASNHITALALDSLAEFEQFESITGYPCDFKQTGFFTIANLQNELIEQVQALKQQGYVINCLSANEANKPLNPLPLSEEDRVIYEPRGGYANPVKATLAYLQGAQAQGGLAFEQEEVISLMTKAGKVVGVKTKSASYSAGCVVIAAGAASNNLLQQHNIAVTGFVPKQIQVGIYRYPQEVSLMPTFIHRRIGLYGRPVDEKHFLLGMTEVSQPNSTSSHNQPNEQLNLLAKSYLPWFSDALWVKDHSGIDMYSQEQVGTASFLPALEGLFLCTGWSGIGFKLAPACAKQAAKQLLKQI